MNGDELFPLSDLNECEVYDACNYIDRRCINKDDGFECSCLKGYTIKEGNTKCVGG